MRDFGPLFDPVPPAEDAPPRPSHGSRSGREDTGRTRREDAGGDDPLRGGPARGELARTFGVLELNQRIEGALREAFPREIWVRGELQGFDRGRRGRHQYFELVEKKPREDAILSRIAVVLWGGDRWRVEQDLTGVPTFQLQDNIEVRIRCRVSLFAPWGKLQLQMVGVDPAFTLGQMAANRERILLRLRSEGLLERNAQRAVPAVPVHVGLVTSVGSAAYNDFVQEIERGGYAVRVTCIDARVQGLDVEATVVAALRTFARLRPDVVVLVRGGGSKADLAGFDSESIARAIAAMPVPVWTGIGHEIDVSVADLVAHTHFKTPTACAAAIALRIGAFVEAVEDRWAQIAALAVDTLSAAERQLFDHAHDVARGVRHGLRTEMQGVAHAAHRLRVGAPRALQREAAVLHRRSGAVRGAVRERLADRRARLQSMRRLLQPARLAVIVQRQARGLTTLRRRVVPLARRRIDEADHRLRAIEAQVRALDPRRVLARGYSLTYGGGGELLRSIAQLEVGATIVTRLHEGEVASRVEETRSRTEEEDA
jgi:exodeoxyribonuclease VII large subunit